MNRIVAALVLVPATALTVGCSGVQDQVQDTARQAASDVASQAATKVAGAAADEVRQQVCTRVSDGQVSAQDKQVLAGLVAAARAAGVPPEITTPLGQVAEAPGDQPPAEAVDALRKACG